MEGGRDILILERERERETEVFTSQCVITLHAVGAESPGSYRIGWFLFSKLLSGLGAGGMFPTAAVGACLNRIACDKARPIFF
jgi:hypothetical protein